MKKLLSIIISLLFFSSLFSQELKKDYIEILYFHKTERCLTCNAIEEELNSVLGSTYKTEIKKGDIELRSIDFEDKANKSITEAYEIETPTLLIIYNKKDKRKFIDLTEEAFSHARTNPSKFKKILKSKINDFFR